MLSSSGKHSGVSHTSPAGLSCLRSGAGWCMSGSHWPHLEGQPWQSFSFTELDQALMHMFPSLLQRETISPILQHLQLRPKHQHHRDRPEWPDVPHTPGQSLGPASVPRSPPRVWVPAPQHALCPQVCVSSCPAAPWTVEPSQFSQTVEQVFTANRKFCLPGVPGNMVSDAPNIPAVTGSLHNEGGWEGERQMILVVERG